MPDRTAGCDGLLDTALRLLARREHSLRELRTKLRLRGHQDSAIEAVLKELAARGLVSDERFAEAFLRSRLERGQGPLKIRAQLRERGVAPGLIDAALAETEIDWDRRAAAARNRRFGKSPPADRNEMARQARFLRGRGYSEGQVARAVLGESSS
ncbi:MAG: regulatory protein RecX [Gammaproteobacteria bacterium]|nr:regulatory protein RecX [Gammaproteobacteria bacterium]